MMLIIKFGLNYIKIPHLILFKIPNSKTMHYKPLFARKSSNIQNLIKRL